MRKCPLRGHPGTATKATYGDATGNEELSAEGRADQDSSKVKQAGDKLKDAAHHVKEALS